MHRLSTAIPGGLGAARVLLVLMVAALLAGVAGCAGQQAESNHLKVVALPYLSFATFYVPQEEGLFEEQGLDVEFVKFQSVTYSMPLLAQGDLDIAGGPISASLLNAIAQDLNIRIVAGRESVPSDCECMALMARTPLYESGELDTVAEMKGRQVAIPSTATLNHFALSKILETAGLTLDDIRLVKMSPQDAIAAFQNGAIDAAMLEKPYNQQAKGVGCALTVESFDRVMPGFQQGFVMYGPSILNSDPELGERFMVAYLEGSRIWLEGKTERNIDTMVKYTSFDAEILQKSCWSPIPSDGQIVVDDILAFQDWAYENGFVDQKIDAEQLIDTRFVNHANDVLGSDG